MTSARDQAIEVMARTMYEKIVPPDPWWEGEESQVHDLWRERAVVVLDALLAATQEQTCPTCGGQGGYITEEHVRAADNEWDAVEVSHPCSECNGDGVVPGTEPLVLLGPERVGLLLANGQLAPTNRYKWDAQTTEFVYRRAGSPDDETHYPGWQRDQAILGGDPSL